MLNQSYIVEASFILVIAYTVYLLIFANDKAFTRNRIYLLTSIVFALVIPMLSFPVFAREVFTYAIPVGKSSNLTPSLVAPSSVNWKDLLAILYWIVFGLLSLRLVYHFFFIRKVLRTSKSIIKDNIKFVITDKLTTPASIFNNLIVNDINIPQEIIDHEKVHMDHGHTWDVLLVEIMKVIFWFNPFIYLLAKCLKDNHEYMADHIAAKSLKSELDYSNILIEYAKSNKHSPILLNTFSSITKKRIIMLSKNKSNNIFKSLLLFPIFLAILTLFSFDTYTVTVDQNGNIMSDSIPESRLDTIITFDTVTGAESMQIERVYPNDIRTWKDTTIVFNADTYEEKLQVVTSEAPRTEIIQQTYTTNEYNMKTGDLETKTYRRYPQELVEVTDTIVTFNYDTYEENFQVVKSMAPREELISKKVTPRNMIKEGQNFDNVKKSKGKVVTKLKGN